MTEQNPLIEVAIVIPVYNEQDCIRSVIESWIQTLSRHSISFHIFAINDGSTDGSWPILSEMAKKYSQVTCIDKENEGHGVTVLRGYRHVIELNPIWVFQVDSDNQFMPDDFLKLWSQRYQFNYLIGRRFARKDPGIRLLISRILKANLFFLFGSYLEDANSPFRLVKTRYLKTYLSAIPDDTFTPNIFLALIASRLGHLKFIPVKHFERRSGKISLMSWRLFKACLLAFRQLWAFRQSFCEQTKSIQDQIQKESILGHESDRKQQDAA